MPLGRRSERRSVPVGRRSGRRSVPLGRQKSRQRPLSSGNSILSWMDSAYEAIQEAADSEQERESRVDARSVGEGEVHSQPQTEYGTYKTVTARFWLWLACKSPQNL